MNKKSFLIVNLPILLGFVLFSHLWLLIHSQFTLWPEIVSSPYLLSKGYSLYKDFIHPYPPLLPSLLVVFFKVFGFKILPLKLIVWMSILAGDLVLYKIAKQFNIQNVFIFLSLILFAVLQTFLEGNMLWYDTALTLPLLLLIYFSLNRKWNHAIVTVVVLTLIKQSAIFVFAGFVLMLLLQKNSKVAKKTIFVTLISAFVILFLLFFQGIFNDAYNWIVYYPTTVWSHFPGYIQMSLTRHEIFSIIIFSIPSIYLCLKRKYIWVAGFYFASLAAVYPRFSFFHFQPALAASAVTFLVCLHIISRRFISVFFAAAFLLSIYIVRPYISYQVNADTRFFSQNDEITAEKMKNVIPPKSIVYFLNMPSQLYVQTSTLPPKPWVDNYGWYFEAPQVQEKTVEAWTKNPPEYIVWKEKMSGNWYDIGVYEPEQLVSWIRKWYEPRWELTPETWIWVKKI